MTGLVAVGIRPSLPFKGVNLLLGNDLAGDKVMVNPLLTTMPCIDQPPDPIEQEIPNLYPSCAITRAMAKKAKQNDGDIHLTGTLFLVSLLNMSMIDSVLIASIIASFICNLNSFPFESGNSISYKIACAPSEYSDIPENNCWVAKDP